MFDLKSNVKIAVAAAILGALPVTAALAAGKKVNQQPGFTQASLQSSEPQKSYSQANDPLIARAQQALASQGVQINVDGRMSEEMERALLNWQVGHGLPITGQLDPLTQRSLNIG